jgi:predicted Fe-Mo cluster-binding NifX family protein
MMKTAFAYWDDRISPVFDIARRIRVVEADSGRIVAETGEVLADDLPAQKALRLVELGVDTLVCGAISRSFQERIAAYGIQVIPFVAGDLSEVIQAWLGGNLERNTFAMPGCCGRGRGRRRGMRSTGKDESRLNGKRRSGMGPGVGEDQGREGRSSGKEDMTMPRGDGTGPRGPGGGQGRGRGGGSLGRTGGPLAGGAVGTCLCPKCGHREPHERGMPCTQKRCPKCDAAMTRE